jgi:hypothetical protein
VSLRHICAKARQPALNLQSSSVSRDQSASEVDSERLKQEMYTGTDPYMHMEVRVTHRKAKLLRGTIIGSHLDKHGQLMVDARTSTLSTTTLLHVLGSDVKELWWVILFENLDDLLTIVQHRIANQQSSLGPKTRIPLTNPT